ncbi:MAG: sugar phosphate nucleotidyltransferase [Patescibacteria group bacterium]|nr:sugar phosphate nucleotidyltransferase [Patescibacteria group bacterium]
MKIVIFAGGVGTRLWPLSRKNTPKQFERIIGDKSTLQLAAHRLLPDFSLKDLYISTGKAYVDTVREQLPDVPPNHVVGEPEMRDVGPAVGLMTSILARKYPNEPTVILWSDHLVKHEEHFRKILKTAGEFIEKDQDRIIFVAQKPRFASENLGWIDFGKEVFSENGISFHSFEGFKYRPDAAVAKTYFESGHHAWNLGYFVTTPQFLLKQYEQFVPHVYEGLMKITNTWETPSFEEKLGEIYPTLEKIHFDNAILERLDHKDAYVVSENIGWSDIGAWEALKEALSEKEEENVTKGNVLLKDSRDSLVFNYDHKLAVGIDLDQMLVISTDDVVLICPKTSVPKIKKLVEGLAGTPHEHLT